jgi:asparagine synthase (glutamine-hydrolysing)
VDKRHASPLRQLEDAVLPHLQRRPCVVSFSGGRDSSAVLAVAVAAARREGLELPVPVTLHYTNAPETREDEWQEIVVRALGVKEWERITIDDELEFLGPAARETLQRFGVLWPANLSLFHYPIIPRAAGGALLTGWGGDWLFDTWRWRSVADVFARRTRARRSDIRPVAFALAPRSVRLERERQRPERFQWLTPAAQEAVERIALDERVSEPRRWRDRLQWWAALRRVAMGPKTFQVLGNDHDIQWGHPLVDPDFLAHLGAASPITGLGDRTSAMRFLFSELLPDRLLSRATKGRFRHAFWGERTIEFARGWDGEGVDASLIDVAGLKAEWRERYPNQLTALVLQQIWLASNES